MKRAKSTTLKFDGINYYPGSPVNQTKWLVFRMIHEKDSRPMGKVWSLDFLSWDYILGFVFFCDFFTDSTMAIGHH